jgi:predicted Zn-dependent peptidase
MVADYNLYTLPNGIRVVHKQVHNTKIVHCGFILDIGSRDEKPEQQGIAHFWEHMAFKGTQKRKAFHILNRLDSVGGELNAYTTKEKVCFYASVLDKHLENSLELLTDITFHSIFPEKQIEKERGVILEEMAMYQDSPEDALQDDFDGQVFKNHPLGYNILGTAESVRSFSREDFIRFVQENMDSSRLIFSCVGNISLNKIKRLTEKHLGPLPVYQSERLRPLFNTYTPSRERVYKSLTQAHCVMGSLAYPLGDEKRLPFIMLSNILGGPAMNSRLNLVLREKKGLVYAVDASYTPYLETGLFSISFATEAGQLNKSIKLVEKELQLLKEKPLGSMQLHFAKEQLIGQLAMAEENNSGLMLMMGKSILDLDRIESLESIFERIRSITATELQDIAHEMFDQQQFSILTFEPEP